MLVVLMPTGPEPAQDGVFPPWVCAYFRALGAVAIGSPLSVPGAPDSRLPPCPALSVARSICDICPHTGPMETRHHLVLWKRLSLDSSTLAAVLILRKCFVLLKSYTAAGLTLTRILLFSILSSLISLRFGLMNSVNWLSFPPYLSNPTFLFKLYVHVEENVDEPKGGKMNYNPDTWREAF